jgi:small subunit ribosomal protein S15
MARMHSRKRGKSGSKKPIKKTVPSWTRYKDKEVEMLVVKLSKDGKPASQIGLILRDTYGIPNVKALCGKSVGSVLKDKNIMPELPENLIAMFKRHASIKKHLETNKHDETALRGLKLAESKISRLAKYSKRVGRIPETWKFDPEMTGFFLE